MCYKQNHDNNILQRIPPHEFIIDVYTKYCNNFKEYVQWQFLKSYVVSVKAKSIKKRHILLICVIKNNNDNNILQPIPSNKFIIDM